MLSKLVTICVWVIRHKNCYCFVEMEDAIFRLHIWINYWSSKKFSMEICGNPLFKAAVLTHTVLLVVCNVFFFLYML